MMMAQVSPMGEVYLDGPNDPRGGFLELACILKVASDPRSSARNLARAVDAVRPLSRYVQAVALAATGRVPTHTAHAVTLLGFNRIAALTRQFAEEQMGRGQRRPAPRRSAATPYHQLSM